MYSTIFVLSSIEIHGRKREEGGGCCCWERGGGLHWGLWWGRGHQYTAAKLMPFFSLLTEKQSVVAYWQGRIQEVKMDLSILRIICFKKKKQKTKKNHPGCAVT